MYNNKKISVIIPVYNEQKTINAVISLLVSLPEVGQIIVVDDGSTDGTKEILNGIFSSKVEIICGENNHGKGWAIRQALQKVSYDIVIFQDAGLEYNPNEYSKLLKPILAGKSDVVYGDRLCLAHFLHHPVHFLGNKFITLLFNTLNKSRIADIATGFRIFKRNVVEGMKFNMDGFEFDIELTTKILKMGFNIYSIPISYFPRTKHDGKKFCWRDRFKMLKSIFYCCNAA